jgi:mRNA-degrading endonuclease RelE of RelBE toxin-antitoxin system
LSGLNNRTRGFASAGFDGSEIRETLSVTKRRVNWWDRAGNILQDATCGKALKAELEGYWSLQVGRTRIIYRRTTGSIDIVAIGPRESVYEEAVREIHRGKEKE